MSLSATVHAVCKSTVLGCCTFAFIVVVVVLVVVLLVSLLADSSVIDTFSLCELDHISIDDGVSCNACNSSPSYTDCRCGPFVDN